MECFKRFRHIDSHFASKQILKGFERSNHRRVKPPPPPQKKSPVSARVGIFCFLFFCHEFPLQPKLLDRLERLVFTSGYGRLPDLWGLSSPPYFVYGKCGLVPITVYMMYHLFHWLAKLKRSSPSPPPPQKKKKNVTAPILKLTYDQKTETFFWGGGGGGGRP